MSTYPPLCERSVLLPDRPELMDRSVGDCLSVMLQEDMLMGSDRPYGSRLSAGSRHHCQEPSTAKQRRQLCHNLNVFYLLLEPVPPDVGEGACTEQRQQPAPRRQNHPEMTEKNPPGNQQQVQV